MSDLKKAQYMILAATPVLGQESVPILEALQRVLTQDIIAAEDLPASDISAMDGKDAGAIPVCLGIVKDDLKAQQTVLNEALRADVIITSGGTSKGKYDLAHKAFASMGMEVRFSNIFSKPGKPSTVGTVGRSLIFGLPGNPSATMLSFEQFIKPALLKMMGHRNLFGSAAKRAYEKKKMNPFFRIDSFNYEHGSAKGHQLASHIPLTNSHSEEKNFLQHKYSASGRVPGRLKVVSK
jgi:molybdopterin molybdotransferase